MATKFCPMVPMVPTDMGLMVMGKPTVCFFMKTRPKQSQVKVALRLSFFSNLNPNLIPKPRERHFLTTSPIPTISETPSATFGTTSPTEILSLPMVLKKETVTFVMAATLGQLEAVRVGTLQSVMRFQPYMTEITQRSSPQQAQMIMHIQQL